MKRITVFILIGVVVLSLTACSGNRGDFNEPKVTKLKPEYYMVTLNAYPTILGFSQDASTIVALRKDTENQGDKKLVFVDTTTAKEFGEVNVDPRWLMEQKRARWSDDGSYFVLSDAWNASPEAGSEVQMPGYAVHLEYKIASPYGQMPIEEKGNVICSPSFDLTGEYITYSVYNKEANETTHYIYKGIEAGDSLLFDSKTKGIASILALSKDKFLESVESKSEGTDSIIYRDGKLKTNIAYVSDAHRSVYIKDYSTDRRRVLIFETSLVTLGTKIATEKIIPKIVEFDDDHEKFVLKEIEGLNKVDVLNGILSPDGRYAVFIAYRNQDFIMVLYDINLSKSYELLKNKDIGSTFIGTLPGRVDGLFMSQDRKICLVADNGVFIFELE